MKEVSGAMPNAETKRLIRSQLWSPVQNTSLWLAWWLHGVISTDEVIDSFHAVQGRHHRVLARAGGAVSGTAAEADEATGLIDLLKIVRAVTDGAPVGLEHRPLVNLALAGMGDPPPLPAGEAASAVAAAGAGISFADADPHVHHVAVPEIVDSSVIYWHWYTAEGRAPQLPTNGPGDADAMLRQATDRAVAGIESSGVIVRWPSGSVGPRMLVGALSDAFGVPGLPVNVPSRAEKLMARADYVAAIIDIARDSAPQSSLDPFLLPLGRAVRVARMTAVDYAQRELLR